MANVSRLLQDAPRPGPRWALVLAAGAASMMLGGCSGSGDDLPREAVSGTVTLDDAPLARGTIQFRPVDSGAGPAVGGGGVVEDGRFSIPRETGLVPGKYKVAVNASDDVGAPHTKGRVVKKSGLAKELIPTRYNARTELSAEVAKGGTGSLKFDLRSK